MRGDPAKLTARSAGPRKGACRGGRARLSGRSETRYNLNTYPQYKRIQMITRTLRPDEWPDAYPLIAQLRTISREAFLASVKIQTLNGYMLVGAFNENALVGGMGCRPVHTLARGFHLHIDDLVVDEQRRRAGIGKALLDFATREAQSRDMGAIFLDARQQAIPFYTRHDFIPHASPSMKKPLLP